MTKSFFGRSSKTSASNKKRTKSKSTNTKDIKLNKFVDKGILGSQEKSK